MKRLLFILTIVFTLSLCGVINAQDLVILHSNDTHSQIEPQVAGSGKGLGGYERRANFIEKIRKENSNVLLLDAGDFSQGTPYFTIFKGDAEIELMDSLKYDAVALGNHEFDNGVFELARRIDKASFPFLCANYDFSGTPLEGKVKPYTIIEKGGKKIGIIGLLTDITSLVNPKNLGGVKYLQPYKIVDSLASYLRDKKKCDVVLLLTHLGYDDGTDEVPSDDMVAKNTYGVDAIVGGHSHTYIEEAEIVKNKKGDDVVIVTANEKGNFIGKLDLWFKK